MIRSFFFLTMTIVILAMSVVHWVKPQPVKISHQDIPDIILEKVTDKKFDNLGQLVTEIRTERLVHDPIAKRDNYSKPIVKRFKKDEPPWILRSLQGHTDAKREKFYFEKAVSIKQAAFSKSPSTTILTDFLEYSIKDNSAVTHRPVQMKQDIFFVKSIGAHIDLKAHEIKLLNKAEGFYG